jgi:hypothetical protein
MTSGTARGRRIRLECLASLAVVLSLVSSASCEEATVPARPGTTLGDAGHFLVLSPDLFANNPSGEAFSVTVHRHVWPADWANRGDLQVRLVAPDGSDAATGAIPGGHGQVVLAVPAGQKGVYRIAVTPVGSGMMWLESSLGQLVAGCGPWDGDPAATGIHQRFYRNFTLHAMVPRRWYFHVPAGTKTFEVATRILPFQSHREDYGFFVMSPRGQRVASFFGGRSVRHELPPTGEVRGQEIEVDEGCAGRFWSLWVVNGDSHAFSDLSLLLRGVPPYLAPTPEQWFDPATGQAPPKPIYDDAPIRLRDRPEGPSRDKYLWTPATFLGDEDYNGWRGEQTLFLWNPDNRQLVLGVGGYIADEAARFPMQWRVAGPDGQRAVEDRGQFGHGTSHRIEIPPLGGGVYRADITAARWFPWSEPTTPIVIAGRPLPHGARFALDVGIARHWFFRVPPGTRSFTVAAAARHPEQVLSVEVHAPDRLVEARQVRGGAGMQVEVGVPAGLDGRIWFLRTDIGSGTRFPSGTGDPQQVRIEADIDLVGVPGILAPTWEQWFDPQRP